MQLKGHILSVTPGRKSYDKSYDRNTISQTNKQTKQRNKQQSNNEKQKKLEHILVSPEI